jgi:uncharacterized protein YdhG (YjbR/CyaY superfamily)
MTDSHSERGNQEGGRSLGSYKYKASRAAFTPLPPVLGYAMSKQEIDNYLASLEEPKRSTLEALRRTILDVIPEAEQCISYGVPAFRLQGKVIAGFAAFKNHLSYLPHSGSVFPDLGDAISQYTTSKGALQFAVDRPLPKALVKKLISIRMRQALGRLRRRQGRVAAVLCKLEQVLARTD